MTKLLYVTGTDTGIGKTFVTLRLMQHLKNKGFSVVGLKPIASGCHQGKDGHWYNEDALLLQAESSISLAYSVINPIALIDPIAPHLAAKKIGISLSPQFVSDKIKASLTPFIDIHLIEGAGGWAVPLHGDTYFYNVIQALQIPTLLVVGMRLGCINHALLTASHIVSTGVPFLGWIGNCLKPDMPALDENIATPIKY